MLGAHASKRWWGIKDLGRVGGIISKYDSQYKCSKNRQKQIYAKITVHHNSVLYSDNIQ